MHSAVTEDNILPRTIVLLLRPATFTISPWKSFDWHTRHAILHFVDLLVVPWNCWMTPGAIIFPSSKESPAAEVSQAGHCMPASLKLLLYFSVPLKISPSLNLHAAECAWRVVLRMTDAHPGHFAEYPCCSISFCVTRKHLGTSGACNFANFSPSALSWPSLVIHGTLVTSSMASGLHWTSVNLLTVLASKIPDLDPIAVSPVFSLTLKKTPWSHTESSFPRAPLPIGRVRLWTKSPNSAFRRLSDHVDPPRTGSTSPEGPPSWLWPGPARIGWPSPPNHRTHSIPPDSPPQRTCRNQPLLAAGQPCWPSSWWLAPDRTSQWDRCEGTPLPQCTPKLA